MNFQVDSYNKSQEESRIGFDTEESGPDSQELPASQVLGHGLWLVPCGLCWGSQCGGIQKLESLCIARDGQHFSNGLSI